MAIMKSGGYTKLDRNENLRNKRQQIIEEERVRTLAESFMAFYDKLVEKYEVVQPFGEEATAEEIQKLSREEIEELAKEYAETKPVGF